MSKSTLVSTRVNGDAVEFACPTDETLMNSLRDRVGPVSYTHLTLPTNREV